MSTIKDVATAAGVSVSTVSNIINNKSSVNIDLYNRVTQVMKDLHYRPNILAKNLRKNQTNFLGVIFWEMDGYSGKLLENVLRRISHMGYQPIVRIVYEDSLELREALEGLISTGVKGILICSPHLDGLTLSELDSQSVPMLLLDYCLHLPGFLTMELDNAAVVEETTALLLEDGQSVGLLTGERRFACEESCWTGFASGCAKAGVDPRELPCLEAPFQRAQLFEELLSQIPQQQPSCWIVSSEYIASCLQEIVSIRGLTPSCLYVLTCDQETRPASPSVRMLGRDTVRCAREAVDLLLAQIQDPMLSDSPNTVIPTVGKSAHAAIARPKPASPRMDRPLRVLLPDAPMHRSIMLLCSDFTNRSGIEVAFTCKNMTELLREIVESCSGEKPFYDVVSFHVNWLRHLGLKGLLRSLEECMDLPKLWAEYLPSVQQVFLKREFASYGVPAEMGVQILAYRDDLFSDPAVQKNYYSTVGLELRPPRSWTEFNIIARYFTRSFNPASPTCYGTCIAGHIPTGLVEEFWPRSRTFCGKLFENRPLELTSLANVRALENLRETYLYSYPDCRTFMDSEQVNQMLTDDIAMIVTYNSYMLLNRRSREKRIRFGPTPSNMTAIDSYLLGIPMASEVSAAGAAFIQWCCSDEMARKSLLLGRMLPKQNVAHCRELEYVIQGIEGIFDHLDAAVFKEEMLGTHLDNNDLEHLFAQGLVRAVYDGEPAQEVMRDLEEQLRRR